MSEENVDGSISPARKSRRQEKEELAHLNDRFASYIDEVRNLKEKNLMFEVQIESLKDQLGNESEDVKRLYETELADARTLIDETAKEKARQQLMASKNAAHVRELETEVKELKEELEILKNRVNTAERNAASMDAQRKSTQADKTALSRQVKDLETERDELRENIEQLRADLERETLSKVDFQNNLQSLNEELSFRNKVHQEEVQNLRRKLGDTSFSFETSLEGNFDTAIDELREKSDMGIADLRAMLEHTYRDKIAKFEDQSNRDSVTIKQLHMDIRRLTVGTKDSNDNRAEISRLQKMVEKLDSQVEAKETELARISQTHASERASMAEEYRSLKEDYDGQIREYELLMDLKVQLDQEIATYRALLQEEENRLNMTPTPRGQKRRTRTQTQTTTEQVKRARLDVTPPGKKSTFGGSATGCIQISEVDSSGRFVEIKNMSTSAESIGAFRIVHAVNGNDEITFRFHNKSKLQGGTSVTVWGFDADKAVHSPPHSIIWRNQPTWGAGTNAVTKLVNKNGEVVATFTQRSETSPSKPGAAFDVIDSGSSSILSFPHLTGVERDSTPSESTTRVTRSTASSSEEGTGGRGRAVGEEHMFHQQGDPQEQRSNCVVC